MSATIIPLLRRQKFDPDMVRIMGEAYDMVCKELHDRGQPDIVKDIIAKRIIEIGKTGERDAKRICERAILDLGLRGK